LQKSELKRVTLYCDGSCLGNPGAGGYAGILEYKGKTKEYFGGEPYTTNNRMELKAVIEGLKLLKEPCSVHIVTDSSYVAQGISKWLNNWIKRDFKKVKNPELWREYIDVSARHQISTEWVRGHNGHPENERCDLLAQREAKKWQEIANSKKED